MTDTGGQPEVRVAAADVAEATAKMRASQRGVIPGSLALATLVQLAATALVTGLAPDLTGMVLGAWITAVTLAILIPVVVGITAVASKRTLVQLAQSLARERVMGDEAHRREFETRLTNALEMADSEPRVMASAGRALQLAVPDGRVEVLLADNSHAHLKSALVTGPDPEG